MEWVILVIVVINLYCQIKRFDGVFKGTLACVCIDIITNTIAVLFASIALFLEILNQGQYKILMVIVLVLLITEMFIALTINKIVKGITK